MPDTVGTAQQPTPVANSVKLRLVEFSEAALELWFSTAEAIFRASGIMDEPTRYSYLFQVYKCRNWSGLNQ